MKSISASIIVLAGAVAFSTGATIQHDQTQMFVCSVGLLLGLVGLSGWVVMLNRE
jgi:hypothetical protein